MVKISQSMDNPNCLYFVCPHSVNGCKFFEWWIPPHMQHNLKVVENDILEKHMDVLSILRELISLNRKLKNMTVKTMKEYRGLAIVIERVGDKLNYTLAFIVVLLVLVVILIYLK
ncbi:hypothetical protein CsSME_00053033 [Camellia sinensis var. sinensis]